MSKDNWKITDQLFEGSLHEAMESWVDWLNEGSTRYVCFANVHMTVEGLERKFFQEKLQQANMICADGQPLVWLSKWLSKNKVVRISGMDALPEMLRVAEEKAIPCFFYGGSGLMLDNLKSWLSVQHSSLNYETFSPPFGPLENLDFAKEALRINDGRPKWIFVILGCPKQEEWMHKMRESVQGVMFGVGGALPVLIGMQKRAPRWMQNSGMEWLFRLIQEPRRMWKRYFWTNCVFIFWVLKLMLFRKKQSL